MQSCTHRQFLRYNTWRFRTNITLQRNRLRVLAVRTLLIDNYDSYTYNLHQLISEVNGVAPTVVRNDELSWTQLRKRLQNKEFHNIVISPGPGSPNCPQDVGFCNEVLLHCDDIPVLGVCLGFQAMAAVHGGTVGHAPEPVHGRLSSVRHNSHPLFNGIPSGVDSGFHVVRYHSLAVDESSLPSCLEGIAWTCGTTYALQEDGEPQEDGRQGQLSSGEGEGSTGTSSTDYSPVLMAMAHRERPHYGVQFHPESVATSYGLALLQNFKNLTAAYLRMKLPPSIENVIGPPGRVIPAAEWTSVASPKFDITWQVARGLLQAMGGSESVFRKLVACHGLEHTFWLDSAAQDRGRFSFMGGPGGPLWQHISFKLPPSTSIDSSPSGVPHGTLTVVDKTGRGYTQQCSFFEFLESQLSINTCRISEEAAAQLPFNFWGGYVGYLGYELKAECGGKIAHDSPMPDATLFLADRLIAIDHHTGDVFSVAMFPVGDDASRGQAAEWTSDTHRRLLDIASSNQLHENGASTSNGCNGSHGAPASTVPTPPRRTAQTNGRPQKLNGQSRATSLLNGNTTPSSCFPRDATPTTETATALALVSARSPVGASVSPVGASVSPVSASASPDGAELAHQPAVSPRTATRQQDGTMDNGVRGNGAGGLMNGLREDGCRQTEASAANERSKQQLFVLREPKDKYIDNIRACRQALYDGKSYEVCLTTLMHSDVSPPAFPLYCLLRIINPAPYAAWMHCGEDGPQVCCSSPERFLRGDRGSMLEARPIKGTAGRHADATADAAAARKLQRSEKDRAENLMIVDLLRNDLSRVCQPASVHVSSLMELETYSTVHQLVSTVRGLRRPGTSVVDAIRAAFPGGSMTGAPKIRTMEIIDQLEGGARGVYSGAIGYIGFNDTFDLNIVIRTAVLHDGTCQIGAGGAIVVQSNPEDEYEEMLLKARALLKTIGLVQEATVDVQQQQRPCEQPNGISL